jgi:pyrroline-5-carboxylate reductase
MALQTTIGFLGYGNMGGAILRGLIQTGTLAADHAIIFDVAPERRAEAEGMGVAVAADIPELMGRAEALVLAVKPQQVDEAIGPHAGLVSDGVTVISIMAGVSIARLQDLFGPQHRIIRVMPNLPALVGAGAAGIACSESCTDDDQRLATAIFESVGGAALVDEAMMDTVTALSGSGPAYFLHMVECMAQAAVNQGMDEAVANQLAAQTLHGAGLLLSEAGEPASVLRERVTSKGGTTAAALAKLGELDFPGTIQAALDAAAARSRELGQ